MPRLVFNDTGEFDLWVSRHVDPRTYEGFITGFNEIVLAPTKSTGTLRYGYIQFADETVAKKFVDKLKQRGISVFKVKAFEWAADRMVGSAPSAAEGG